MSTQLIGPWSITYAQAFELAEKQAIVEQQNTNAMGAYLNQLISAAQMGAPANSVPGAVVLGIVPNTDPTNADFYSIVPVATFTAPQPAPVPPSANPVGALVTNTSVYAAVLPAAANYTNGQTYVDPARGTFTISVTQTPWGPQRWWTLTTPPAAPAS